MCRQDVRQRRHRGVISGLIYMGAALAGLLIAVRGLELLLSPSKMNLTIFRPYRGEAWARGVQEEDSVHFDFSGPKPPAAPIVPTWDDIVATSGVTDAPAIDTAAAADRAIEDTTKESVAVERTHPDV